jgi:hypothetical protein
MKLKPVTTAPKTSTLTASIRNCLEERPQHALLGAMNTRKYRSLSLFMIIAGTDYDRPTLRRLGPVF